jgi:biotin carboxyl carrier protein
MYMKKQKFNSNGSGVMVFLLAIVVLMAIGFVGFKVLNLNKDKNKQESNQPGQTSSNAEAEKTDSNAIVMKSIGFKLDYYNEATNSAGDVKFTKLPLFDNQIMGDFGQQDPRTPNDPTKRNPQPTFILPLGTKVLSLIDGTVTKVETLYSGDTTVWVTPFKDSPLNFETEHVNNVLVKVGDQMKSGQIIAEVSDYDTKAHPGFGIVEIGVLGQSGNRPSHSCPFEYLDKSVKEDTYKKITALHESWNKYLGKTVYGSKYAVPGCVTTDPVTE